MGSFPGGTLALALLIALVVLAVVKVEIEVPELVIWETNVKE